MRELLRALAAEGRTVLVSSHLMSELEGTADHLIVIGRGRLLADVSVAELLADASDGRVEIQHARRGDGDDRAGERRGHGELERSGTGRGRRACRRARVATVLASHGVPLDGLETSRGRRSRRRTSGSRAARASTGGTLALSERGEDVTATIRSEWTKLRTQRGTLVALVLTGVLMVGMSAFFATESETGRRAFAQADDDVVQLGLTGIAFASSRSSSRAPPHHGRVRDGDDPDDADGDAGQAPRPAGQGGRC